MVEVRVHEYISFAVMNIHRYICKDDINI
jgi:hypothetical protein